MKPSHARAVAGTVALALLTSAMFLALAGSLQAGSTQASAPRVAKQEARAALVALVPSGDKRVDEQIGRALAHVNASLDTTLWAGDSHLTAAGQTVFDEEQKAVKELMSIKSPPPAVTGAVDALVQVDRRLAEIAITEAAGGDPKELGKANDEMAKASTELAKGNPDKAIDHYGKAWTHAVKAAPPGGPQTFTLKSCNASDLIAAITQANGTPDADTIVLRAGCTYRLTSGPYDNGNGPNGLPIVTAPLTIHGNAAAIARDPAAPLFRLLQVEAPFSLDHATVSRGHAGYGGGIYSLGTLRVTDTSLAGNAASHGGGAIYTGGETTLDRDTFSGNTAAVGSPPDDWNNQGGAVAASGPSLTVRESTFTDNAANMYGGAVAAGAETVTIERSSFTANSVESGVGGAVWGAPGHTITVCDSTFALNSAGAGGGIGWEWDGDADRTLTVVGSTFDRNTAGAGGGLWAYMGVNGHVVVTNSTFSDNAGGGGIAVGMWGTLDVTSSTLAGNAGGGIALLPWGTASSTATLRNTILSNNDGWNCSAGPEDVLVGGGDNINYNGGGCPATFLSADPLLGPLAWNGGPTQTMALGTGSAALDAADDTSCPATDQRGVTRPQGAHCDIGAYERMP